MQKADRYLQTEIRALIASRDAWPHFKSFVVWLRAKGKGIGGDRYTRLRNVGAAPLDLIQEMVAYHLHMADQPGSERERARTFLAILAELGMADPSSVTPKVIAEAICQKQEDYLGVGSESFRMALDTGVALSPAISPTATDDEIRNIVRWIYVNLARRVAPSSPPLSSNDAIALSEDIISVPLADYQKRTLCWRQKYPWVVAPVRVRNILVGAPIVLPLRRAVYDEIRAGKRFASEVTADDLQIPSQHLIVEAVSERTVDQGGIADNCTLHLRAAISRQLGQFCARPGATDLIAVRMLSRRASSESTQRLEGCQFRPTGTREYRSNVELMELVINPLDNRNGQAIVSAIVEFLGKLPPEQAA